MDAVGWMAWGTDVAAIATCVIAMANLYLVWQSQRADQRNLNLQGSNLQWQQEQLEATKKNLALQEKNLERLKAQLRSEQLITSAKILSEFRGEYDSLEMRKHRRNFADYISGGGKLDLKDDYVPAFMERLGYFLTEGILDERMIWNEFSWEIVRWYGVLTGKMRDAVYDERKDLLIALRLREGDPTLFENLDKLNEKIVEIDKARGGPGLPTALQIKEFLSQERSLPYKE